MKCGFCNNDMAKGYLPALKNKLQWIPENESIPLTIFGNAKGGVALSKTHFWTRKKIEAYFCCKCRKEIIPVKEI